MYEKNEWSLLRFSVDTSFVEVNEEPVQELPKEDLEILVKNLLKENEVIRTRQVDKIYQLANIYRDDGKNTNAAYFYKQALQTDAANIHYQNELAKLLLRCGRNEEAMGRLMSVFRFSENPEIIQSAKKTLKTHSISLPKLAEEQNASSRTPTIALVPVGSPNLQLLQELRPRLENALGLGVCILSNAVSAGATDRLYAELFVSEVYTNLLTNLTDLQREHLRKKIGDNAPSTSSYDQQCQFIETFFSEAGNSVFLQRFWKELHELGDKGQHSTKSLTDILRTNYSFNTRDDIKAYIGVTEKSLHSGGANFCFGATDGAYGVISSYEFSAAVTGEQENRPRVVTRLLKQALSSTCFILLGPRCAQPFCARAYPKTLNQHDQKPDSLCSICQEQLSAYKKKPWSEAIESEYMTLADTLYREQNYQQAYRVLKTALTNNPTSSELNKLFGYSSFMLEKYDEAKEALSKTKLDEGIHEVLGRILYSEANYKRAPLHLLKAKDSFETKEMLGICYWNTGEREKARPLLETVAKNQPTATSCFLYGVQLQNENQCETALFYLNQAEKMDPNILRVHHQKGIAHAKLGHQDQALQSFNKFATLAPDDPDAWNNLGYFHYQQQKPKQALKYYKTALQCTSNNGLIHYNMALLYYSENKRHLALKAYQLAVKNGYSGSPSFQKMLLVTPR